MQIRGYAVGERLLQTGPYAIYRGRRERDQQPVLLKVPLRVSPRRAEADALEREFDLLQGLSIPGVPRAYDFAAHPETPCLILEDRGLAPPFRSRSSGVNLARFFPIARKLSDILAAVHGENLVCGGVSPRALLSSPDLEELLLADFSLAARTSLDNTLKAPLMWSASPCTSPEQTGRINRAIDHRSDLYSLGATLYELLLGHPPFASDDPLELIHAHLAKTPAAPRAVDAGVPAQVSAIIMRLLAKAAEDRYQSAIGVAADLDACAREWTATRTITAFDLGRHDASDRFLIPQRLYGRDRELSALMTAFDQACEGRPAVLLVSGYSGIGKTSLISELYRPIVKQRGYFLSGKFDQVVRNVPYGALIQAFRGFVWQVLAESEEDLAQWRARLAAALGSNGGVIAEVLPEIEFIVGAQPAPPALGPAEAQNRFRYIFQSFLGAVAREQHPLVVFLDDLQWADAATLDLLHALLTGADIHHVLFIGAYRDNEVDATHLLTWAIDRLETAGARVHRLALGPLALPDVVAFLRDTLHGDPVDLAPLAGLILQKTDGNPFFVIQFLKSLRQEGLFRFDQRRGAWTFALDAIAAAGMTDNVIDLMTRKIRRLSADAQAVLTLAACIGNPFDWRTFLTVSRQIPEASAAGLQETLAAGLLQPAGSRYEGSDADRTSYAFLHDRVQQAAYDLISAEQKQKVHLDVGRLLLAETGPQVPEERLFEIVHHLNLGGALIQTTEERLQSARLNLAAGRKAKTSAAYRAACTYLEEGIGLLPEDLWQDEYELMFALRLEAAECQYLAGEFGRAEYYFESLLGRASTPFDKSQVHSLRIVLYENLSRYADAVASARDGLALFGIVVPERDEEARPVLDEEIAAIERLRAGRPIASLVELHAATDDEIRVVMRIFTLMWAAAYIGGHSVVAGVISAMMVRLSLEHGLTEDSAYGCVTHAITIGPVKRDYAAAYEWGELALQLNDRFGDKKRRAKIHQQYHAHVKLWRRPFATCLPHAREACRSGLESGDFTYAGYGAVSESWPALVISRSLEQYVRDYSPSLGLLERIQMGGFRTALQVTINWALALQGRTAGPLSLSNASFDEEVVGRHDETAAPFFLTFVYTAKLHLAVLLERFDEAVEMERRAREVTVVGTIWPVLLDFWGSLAMAGAWATASDAERRRFGEGLTHARGALHELADSCPENFRCFWLAVSGELQRLDGDLQAATALYEESLAYARETGNLQQEALANELCGRVWLARGNDRAAAGCLQAARSCYLAWGAIVKAGQIEDKYGRLAHAAESPTDAGIDLPPGSSAPDSAQVDMATVLKLAHAIAEEIDLDELLRKLMTIALENAGAERGLFLQERDGALMVEADAASSGQVRVQQVPWEEALDFSHSVVRYVRRTGQDLVVGNLAGDDRFAADDYVRRTNAKSVLCVPVGQQGRSAGLLYLENNLTTEAFTPERIEMMRILAAQAAISLENARLYRQLEVLKNRLEAENVYLQEEIRTQHNFNEIVGNSQPLLDVLRKVELVAPTETTVLLLGETGSGKELFARAVHSRSPRNHRPLVKVNCGAIAPGLVESELFGHVKGAFTGAVDKRVGRFELANGGTILLDEVGELPLEAQVKLLRVLQEQEFEPVGSSRTIRVDVRVIAATNRDLEQAVREGTFRADLLYRLNVFPIQIPPLRARKSDIPLLATLFVSGLSRRLGKPIQGFSTRSMEQLVAYSWPGNVRELQNVVERAAILSPGPVLEVDRSFMQGGGQPADSASNRTGETLDHVQRAHIIAVLQSTGGVVEGARGAATILGLHPNTLRSRMKKLGISPMASSGS